MLAYFIIDREDENDETRDVIDYISTNIDDVIERYDIRVLYKDELNSEDMHSVPCLHVEGENYYTKRDIMSMLRVGYILEPTNIMDRAIRELKEVDALTLSEPIREEDTNERIDAERQAKLLKHNERRNKLMTPQQPLPKKAIVEDYDEDTELIELDNSTMISRIMGN